MMGPGPGSGKPEDWVEIAAYPAPVSITAEHETFTIHRARGSVTTILAAIFCSSSRQAGAGGGRWPLGQDTRYRCLHRGDSWAGIAGDNWATTSILTAAPQQQQLPPPGAGDDYQPAKTLMRGLSTYFKRSFQFLWTIFRVKLAGASASSGAQTAPSPTNFP